MSTVNFVLWKTNSILLQVAEVRDNKKTIQPLDLRFCFYNFFIPHLFLCLSSPQDFYQRERHAKFHLLPDTLDLWAESTQQRLLGYQEQAVKLVNVSRRGNGLPHE